MSRTALDTNVLASGFVGVRISTSTAGEVLRRWRAGEFTLISSEPILRELDRVFGTSYFARRLSAGERQADINLLRREAFVTELTVQVRGIATHPEDDLVLSTALSGRAEYLVTGDGALRRLGAYDGVTILSPREFLERLGGTGNTEG